MNASMSDAIKYAARALRRHVTAAQEPSVQIPIRAAFMCIRTLAIPGARNPALQVRPAIARAALMMVIPPVRMTQTAVTLRSARTLISITIQDTHQAQTMRARLARAIAPGNMNPITIHMESGLAHPCPVPLQCSAATATITAAGWNPTGAMLALEHGIRMETSAGMSASVLAEGLSATGATRLRRKATLPETAATR